jgi:hypothetical protein
MRPNLLAPSAIILAAMSQFVFAQAPASVASHVAAQNALFEDAWQANLKMNPIRATAVGDYRYNDQLGDYSLATNATRHQRNGPGVTEIPLELLPRLCPCRVCIRSAAGLCHLHKRQRLPRFRPTRSLKHFWPQLRQT